MNTMIGRLSGICLALAGLQIQGDDASAQSASIEIEVVDQNEEVICCRVHLRDSTGKAVRVDGQPFWHDHLVCSGRVSVPVLPGDYRWQIERGPEHARASGSISLVAGQQTALNVRLPRIASLRDAGWFSGDLHVHRPASEIEQLMRAEDLDFATVVEWWNGNGNELGPAERPIMQFDGDRVYELRSGEDEREGGALLYFGLGRPLDIRSQSREFPSPMRFVDQARAMNENVWIDIEKPFWWDVPTWIASGRMNSIGLANNHMCRDQMLENEAWGRPRDVERLPSPTGNGYWTQEIYYHLLESGIRLPPSAGSASGVLPNPVGYNRVYVHLGDKPFTRDAWFRGLAAGRCFVTNGPLLRVTANGQLPGEVIQLEEAATRVELTIELTSNDPIRSVEVIHNGRVAKRLPCRPESEQTLSTSLTLTEPGWFLVRSIADVRDTFRFASTAPWYIEGPAGQKRISKASSQFFLDWLNERTERIQDNVRDPEQEKSVLAPHRQARIFWQRRLQNATTK
ncbi:MAG: CehA/McbA family metallohydrolase [Planctomycetota bacterium]